MFAELAFFSFVSLADAEQSGAYNRWHQLDHRPENLALPGVAWGDRWARPSDYVPLTRSSGEFEDVSYVAMYWFRPPVEQSVAEWDALGEASFQWGRGPLIPGVSRPMLAFFRPVKGYAAPRALVAPEILPYRPNRGLHVTVTRFDEPHATGTHEAHRVEDRETVPAILALDGVAGAWTFSYSHPQRHSSLPFDPTAQEASGSIRIRVVYLEEDPAEMAAHIHRIDDERQSPVGRVLLSGPVKTIIPWQDW
ncbi:hypothetical protein NQ166_13610 [Microbacterium sp. zg.Y1090]|uniref:hypothetical protein n=1 Tax=Microbacterium TaxID=33882 RepID=UPI00214CB05F|nr:MULTISPECIES: hypothetical protein [unclassified Microbacterium]MCR2813300.1 hypothetical protein [Microbacterium sp. zg.Y1084]MCR2819866.1 hypothetical protein [Microbacterium sp. zg.Y1090]MDL5487977.1 hypothetical protein [Microbacterium sp. zg-Y1211]WIM28577.1 hypothetical protein QNO26_01405 [Microbacterium sp. zg-Y1090]